MPPDETTVQPAAPAANAVADATARAAKDKAMADKWASEAVKALNGVKDEPAAAEKAAVEKPRDKEGKFVAEKAKAKEKASAKETEAAPKTEALPKVANEAKTEKPAVAAHVAAKPGDSAPDKGGNAPAEAKETATEPFAGGLGKAKRLVREGKIADALKLIDCDPEKIPGGQWAAWRKENRKKEAEVLAAHAEVERQRETVKSEARELVAQLRPFAEAKQALDAGDEDRVFEIIFKKTVDEWQRGRLARMHRGDLSNDPAVVEATRRAKAAEERAEQLRRDIEERDRKAAEREQEAAIERRRGEYREELKGQLAESADERLQRAAELPWFVKMVHDEQLNSYKFDPDTRSEDYLTVDEAIERVYDPERLTAAQWRQLTDELGSSEQRDPGTKNQVASDRRGNDVKRAAKAPTSLSRSATVEAAPERKRTPKESLEHWSSIAAKLAAEGKYGTSGKKTA